MRRLCGPGHTGVDQNIVLQSQSCQPLARQLSLLTTWKWKHSGHYNEWLICQKRSWKIWVGHRASKQRLFLKQLLSGWYSTCMLLCYQSQNSTHLSLFQAWMCTCDSPDCCLVNSPGDIKRNKDLVEWGSSPCRCSRSGCTGSVWWGECCVSLLVCRCPAPSWGLQLHSPSSSHWSVQTGLSWTELRRGDLEIRSGFVSHG